MKLLITHGEENKFFCVIGQTAINASWHQLYLHFQNLQICCLSIFSV